MYVAVEQEEPTFFWGWKVEIVEGGFKHPKTGYQQIHTFAEILELSKEWDDKIGSYPTAEMDFIEREFLPYNG